MCIVIPRNTGVPLLRRGGWILIGCRYSLPQRLLEVFRWRVRNSHLGQSKIPRWSDFSTIPTLPWFRMTSAHFCLPICNLHRGAFNTADPQLYFWLIEMKVRSFWRGRGWSVSVLLELSLSLIFTHTHTQISQASYHKGNLYKQFFGTFIFCNP